jgi:hypothetical protein
MLAPTCVKGIKRGQARDLARVVLGLLGEADPGQAVHGEVAGLPALDPLHAGRLDKRALRLSVGIVFQSYNLFPHLTALQNIMLAPTLPEPDWPISATTSPRPTSNETPSSTFSGPKLLWTLAGKLINNSIFQPFIIFVTVALFYFAICYPLSAWSRGRGGLAGAGLADQRHHLAAADLERDAVQHLQRAENCRRPASSSTTRSSSPSSSS